MDNRVAAYDGRGVLIDHAFVGSKEKSKGTNEENEKRRGADEQII